MTCKVFYIVNKMKGSRLGKFIHSVNKDYVNMCYLYLSATVLTAGNTKMQNTVPAPQSCSCSFAGVTKDLTKWEYWKESTGFLLPPPKKNRKESTGSQGFTEEWSLVLNVNVTMRISLQIIKEEIWQWLRWWAMVPNCPSSYPNSTTYKFSFFTGEGGSSHHKDNCEVHVG